MPLSHYIVRRFIIISAAALALPIAALAGPLLETPFGVGPGGGEVVPHHLRQLNLTEAQQDKVFALLHAQEPNQRERMKIIRKTEQDLRALAAAPDYSDARAKVLVDQLGRARSDLDLARVRTDHQLFELLTQEQRTKLAELRDRGPDQSPRRDGGPGGEPGRPARGGDRPDDAPMLRR